MLEKILDTFNGKLEWQSKALPFPPKGFQRLKAPNPIFYCVKERRNSKKNRRDKCGELLRSNPKKNKNLNARK
jgi:hypothetical protein